MESVEARVARGAAWLDENEPGWERRVDVWRLAIRSECNCVIGQLHGNYNRWVRGRKINVLWPSEHGFFAAITLDADGWVDTAGIRAADEAALDAAWIALIKERFDSGTLSDADAG